MPVIDVEYKMVESGDPLFDYVKYCWKLSNTSSEAKHVTILPDGFFDVIFTISRNQPFSAMLMGIGVEASQSEILPYSTMAGISFKLLAAEYIFNRSIAAFFNSTEELPASFLNITQADMDDFTAFCSKALHHLNDMRSIDVDSRKKELFSLLYQTNGVISIKELSAKIYWSSRQINRYFNQWFGLSLKAYCNILRYRASFNHIKEGKLFPEEDFTDQAHFIKEVKKYSGVTPKELAKNSNDRFIQFSTLPKK